MVVCLRHMIASPAIYEFLRKRLTSTPSTTTQIILMVFRMVLFCRDGNNLEFNRDAWAMFYQLIYYHQGVLENLVKANLLAPFLKLVGTSYNSIIMTNGLHFI